MKTRIDVHPIQSGIEEMRQELRFPHLNQAGFVRAETPLAQWFLLVNEAWEKTRFPLIEEVRDYLVLMLSRFYTRPNFMETLKYFRYCEYMIGASEIDGPCAQDIADMAVQYVAYFPESSQHRHEPRSLRFTQEIAESLYARLARESVGKDDWHSSAFREMSKHLGVAVVILRSTCPRFIEHEHVESAATRAQALSVLSDHEAWKATQVAEGFQRLYCKNPFAMMNNTTRQ